MKENRYTLPVFIPDEGCPFKCIYCDQRSISGHDPFPDSESLKEYITNYLTYFKDKSKRVMLSFFGGSFTGISEEKQIWYLETVSEFISSGKIHEIGLSTRPDYIDNKKLKLLKQYNVSTIELGAQSLSDEVLHRSCRGHDSLCVQTAAYDIKNHGYVCGLQFMPGLPGETDETFDHTIIKALEIKPDIARIYPVIVIKGTPLEKMFNSGEYIPLSLEKAVQYSEKMFRAFEDNRIKVIRIGLQNSTEISPIGKVAAGPFHSSFGQLVISEYFFKNILEVFKNYDKIHFADIYTGKGLLSTAKGHRCANETRLRQLTGCDDIRIIETEAEGYLIRIDVNKGRA